MPAVDSNAVSLLNIENGLNAQQRGWIRTFTSGVDLASIIPMVAPNIVLGYKYYEEDETTSSNFAFRALNEALTTTKDADLREIEKKLTFLNSKMAADYRLAAEDPYIFDKKINARLRKLPNKLTYQLVNGSSDNKREFIGMKEMATGNYLIGPSSLSVGGSAANFQSFMNYVWQAEETLVRDNATEIFCVMNQAMWIAINTGKMLTGAAALGTAYSDVLQKDMKVISESRVLITRNDDAKNAVLPFTESSSTCSMYFVGVSNVRDRDPNTGEMPNGVFAVSDGMIALRGHSQDAMDYVMMELAYLPIFPTGSIVRLKGMLQ